MLPKRKPRPPEGTLRKNKVAQARRRMELGFYDTPGPIQKTAKIVDEVVSKSRPKP
jgi:hypothetical protein